jgi:hypothetical protein
MQLFVVVPSTNVTSAGLARHGFHNSFLQVRANVCSSSHPSSSNVITRLHNLYNFLSTLSIVSSLSILLILLFHILSILDNFALLK